MILGKRHHWNMIVCPPTTRHDRQISKHTDFRSVSFDWFSRLEVIVAEGPCSVLTSVRVKHDSKMTDNRLTLNASVILLVGCFR